MVDLSFYWKLSRIKTADEKLQRSAEGGYESSGFWLLMNLIWSEPVVFLYFYGVFCIPKLSEEVTLSTGRGLDKCNRKLTDNQVGTDVKNRSLSESEEKSLPFDEEVMSR